MSAIFTCFLLATLAAVAELSDFSLKGDACSKLDRCGSKSALKTCSCDIDCHLYDTCCQDKKKPHVDVSSKGFQCYNRQTVNPVFAKRSCLDDFRGHIGTKLACLEDEEDAMDVKGNLLVTNRETKVTYWNKHCARCNDEVSANLEFWSIVVLCPSHKEVVVDGNLIRKNLTFDHEKRHWGLEISGTFLQCVVKYFSPPYIEEVRHCMPNIIDNCPTGYDNEEISSKCSQYYAERKLKNSETYFKNVHCALCNGADVKDLECPGMMNPEENAEESDFGEMVEEVFTNGEWLEKKPVKIIECSKGYAYDPFREKCRVDEIREEATTEANSAHTHNNGYLSAIVVLCIFLLETRMKCH